MKNKKLSWVLLPVVLGIWGMIGWKVYSAFQDEEESGSEGLSQSNVDADSTSLPDSYSLVLNYRDPFLDNAPVRVKPATFHNSEKQQVSKGNSTKPEPVTAPAIPRLEYLGLVKEQGRQKTVGFLIVNAETNFVVTGDEISGVKIGRIWADSIEVVWEGKKKFIRR